MRTWLSAVSVAVLAKAAAQACAQQIPQPAVRTVLINLEFKG
jgi:hypothetical protein